MAKKKVKISNENFDTDKEKVDEVDAETSEEEAVDVESEDDKAEASEDGAEESKSENAKSEDGDAEDSSSDDNSDNDSQENNPDSSDDADTSQDDKNSKKSKHQQIIEELNDKVMRQMAEFENFRKRSEKEKSKMYDMGAKNILEKILPVVDNFERGLESAEEGDSFADGMKMIYKQLMTSLEDIGVKEIEAEGKEFDPEYHNAVMHIDDEDEGENVVVEVLQKGYMYNDDVLRHAMVKVAN